MASAITVKVLMRSNPTAVLQDTSGNVTNNAQTVVAEVNEAGYQPGGPAVLPKLLGLKSYAFFTAEVVSQNGSETAAGVPWITNFNRSSSKILVQDDAGAEPTTDQAVIFRVLAIGESALQGDNG